MHYKNGRPAKVDDLVIGKIYNRPGTQVAKVIRINESSTACNCTVAVFGDVLHPLQEEYTQCDYLFHVDDAYVGVNGGDQSPNPPATGTETVPEPAGPNVGLAPDTCATPPTP